jgi:hypothetical protein
MHLTLPLRAALKRPEFAAPTMNQRVRPQLKTLSHPGAAFHALLKEQSASVPTPVSSPDVPLAAPASSASLGTSVSAPPIAASLAPAATNPVAPRTAPVPASAGLPAMIAALPNEGLMSHPTGNNALSGGTIPYNPDYYATLEAATGIAQQVGGTVVDMRGQISNNQSEYYIDLPNGTTINAGNLVAICNNPLYKGNSGIMDHMIAEMLNNNAIGTTGVGTGQYTVKNGQISYDPYAQVQAPAPYHT